MCGHGLHPSCSQVVGTTALRAFLSSRRLKADGSPERFPMTDAIDVYLDTILFPQLEHLRVHSFPGAIEAVVTDIRRRLQSVLSHWQDMPTRNTLLLLGREEGAFYEPQSASLEIRAFVVVTVRNSLLEDLGIPGASLIPADVPDAEKPMQEADVQPITEAAIRYWQTVDLQGLHVLPPAAEDDPFGHLRKDAPRAWYVLSSLANARGRTVSFAPCQAPRPSLPKATVEHDPEERSVVLSGITPGLIPWSRTLSTFRGWACVGGDFCPSEVSCYLTRPSQSKTCWIYSTRLSGYDIGSVQERTLGCVAPVPSSITSELISRNGVKAVLRRCADRYHRRGAHYPCKRWEFGAYSISTRLPPAGGNSFLSSRLRDEYPGLKFDGLIAASHSQRETTVFVQRLLEMVDAPSRQTLPCPRLCFGAWRNRCHAELPADSNDGVCSPRLCTSRTYSG